MTAVKGEHENKTYNKLHIYHIGFDSRFGAKPDKRPQLAAELSARRRHWVGDGNDLDRSDRRAVYRKHRLQHNERLREDSGKPHQIQRGHNDQADVHGHDGPGRERHSGRAQPR